MVAGLAATTIDVAATWFLGYPGISGPSWAACLVPAFWGLAHGVWFASRRFHATIPGRDLALRKRVLFAACMGAIALALVEQQLASGVTRRMTLGWRAGSVAFLAAFLPQIWWRCFCLATESDNTDGGLHEHRSRRTRG